MLSPWISCSSRDTWARTKGLSPSQVCSKVQPLARYLPGSRPPPPPPPPPPPHPLPPTLLRPSGFRLRMPMSGVGAGGCASAYLRGLELVFEALALLGQLDAQLRHLLLVFRLRARRPRRGSRREVVCGWDVWRAEVPCYGAAGAPARRQSAAWPRRTPASPARGLRPESSAQL